MKKASDIQAMILNAVIANTRTKIVMRMADPDDAAYLARVLFVGFVDYAEYKPGTERPVAVGNDKVIVRGTSRSVSEAEHETHAYSRGRSRGEAVGTATSTSTGIGEFSGTGDSSGLVMAPPAQLFGPNAPNASVIPYALSQSSGESSSRGSSEQTVTSESESRVSIDVETESETHGHGTSRGWTRGESENETYITRYEWVGSQLFSAVEQAERLTGEIMNLAVRECFLKRDNHRPVRTRTADLPPSFRSAYAKRIISPIIEGAIARSPYLQSAAEVDAQIAARVVLPPLPAKPAADFSRAPLPVLDDLDIFAADFFKRRGTPADPPPKARPKSRPGRKPRAELPPGAAGRFTVVDGEGVDNVPPRKR
jgi:hypothetical protein